MDIGSIFLLLSLVILVVFFIIQPFFGQQPLLARPPSPKQPVLNLESERDRVLQSLQELDFDYSLGKVPEEDYPVQRNDLLQHGAEVLQKLDALQPQSRPDRDRLEEALNARRQALSQSAANPNENLEALILSRRRARNGSAPREKSVGFCPKCGKPIQKSDHFCPKCGYELS